MEQVYRIRNMKKFEGKSLRKISQITGHDFETVKKYIDKKDFNQTIRHKQRRQGKLSPYKSIMTVVSGFDAAIEAFEEGIKLGVSDPDSIWATYCRLTAGTLPEPEVSLPDTVPELKKYIPDIRAYDELFLFQVISECYEKRSVIITTNLEFSKWNGIFYDEKLTSAIIDRLVHHSHLLFFRVKATG